MKKHRGTFGSKLGFVLAAAGSAVGLGNIWRFPYLAARYGGGVFLLFYILFVITFGFSLMIAELAIGRKTAHSPVGAFRTLDRRFTIAGMLAIAVCALVLPYYTVVGGWVMKYIATYLSGRGALRRKTRISGNTSPLPRSRYSGRCFLSFCAWRSS